MVPYHANQSNFAHTFIRCGAVVSLLVNQASQTRALALDRCRFLGMGSFRVVLRFQVGISTFFLVYIRTPTQKITWGLKHPTRFPPTVWYFVLACIALGLPSLLTYRIGLFGGGASVALEQGRFVGNVTGYEYSAHAFLLVASVFLILAAPRLGRILGWAILFTYVVASFADPWSRFLGVSSLLAMAIIDTLRRSKPWPRALIIVAAVFVGTVLWQRGHTTFNSGTEFWTTASQAPANVIDTISSGDAAMLATFYLESYTKDTLGGFDYGIPIINYSITGLLPSKYFPWKYSLIDSLRARQDPQIGSTLLGLLSGGKSTLIGSFYAEGGLIGVILLTILVGYLSRKLDCMIDRDSPQLVRATGIVWMSLLWMVWGSADYWALTQLGMVALPTIGIWLLSPKATRRSRRRWQQRAQGYRPPAQPPLPSIGMFGPGDARE